MGIDRARAGRGIWPVTVGRGICIVPSPLARVSAGGGWLLLLLLLLLLLRLLRLHQQR
jgi:hypothetical protein